MHLDPGHPSRRRILQTGVALAGATWKSCETQTPLMASAGWLAYQPTAWQRRPQAWSS